VEHKSTSYIDRDGEHPGPFVSGRGFDERYLLSDVVEIVACNARRCVYCGEGVTATNPETDFCSGCYYSGTAFNGIYAEFLGKITRVPGVRDASFWHTGGNCWLLAVRLMDGRLLTPSEGFVENGEVWPEPTIPEGPDGRWALVVSETEEAWDEWDENRIEMTNALYTEDELVAAIEDLAARPGALTVSA